MKKNNDEKVSNNNLNKKEEKTKENKNENIKKYKKREISLYLILRILVIICLILQVLNRNWNNVFLCVLTLILFMIPIIIDKRLNIHLPNVLETIILLFIFAAEILGEIQNFYGIFAHWDTMLHTINGFLCAAIGFSLIDILNREHKFHINLSPVFVALVSFCFSMTIGVLWEFFEYGTDNIIRSDTQKDEIVSYISSVSLNEDGKNVPVVIDNISSTVIYYMENGEMKEQVIQGGYLDIGLNDTMKDLLVNFFGAIIFSIIGMLYIQNRDNYRFAEKFIPTMKE